ncbi:DEKNAAC102185 [Brettanomyces naardenensis]|uniref:DEKNAAC102185 n=1 Tax=Brettanomyces naardenensis TaxID=13370 RepID=A0A448YK05_BRENA|nr:DEKNAAC102185 [Brettanomyces naardenensis]
MPSEVIEAAPQEAENPTGEDQQQALDIYKKALTFNVIAKYDPLINQLIHLSPYCVVYKFSEEGWNKLDYQGPIALYSRNTPDIPEAEQVTVLQLLEKDYYKFGLIILNRAKPENFTIGLLGNKYLIDQEADHGMLIERKEELVIVRDFKGDTFGLWLFDEKDREYLYDFLKYCVEN